MTPAEELRAAAAKLREATYEVPDGPWGVTVMRDHTYGIWTDGTGFSGEDDQVATANIEPVAAWMALLGPDKAELLAVWLETEAHCLGVGDGVGEKTADLLDAIAGEPLKLSVTVVADTSIPALAFAHAILGAQS